MFGMETKLIISEFLATAKKRGQGAMLTLKTAVSPCFYWDSSIFAKMPGSNFPDV